MPLLLEVEEGLEEAMDDPVFLNHWKHMLSSYVGRPSPLLYAKRLTLHAQGGEAGKETGRGKIFLKRDELNHTGSHKINNCLGQALLAQRLNKRHLIAETGAGQHGVATATMAAHLGLQCSIFMGSEDMKRQRINVEKMRILGAHIHPVKTGSGTLKDAMSGALRFWVAYPEGTFYVIGSVAGPHPYPRMVRAFQTVIGQEAREQFSTLKHLDAQHFDAKHLDAKHLDVKHPEHPDVLIACVGGGSNAIGLFGAFLDLPHVKMFGVEADGKKDQKQTAATLSHGSPGILHGAYSYALQDDHGQILEAQSLAPGLDYPGVGPEHAYLKETGRVEYVHINDQEAMEAFELCARLEGILPAFEPSHALAFALKYAEKYPDENMIVNLCGRGDKDLETFLQIAKESPPKELPPTKEPF